MLSIPQFVAEVPTSGFYGLVEGQVVPLMRDRGTLYRVAWASSVLPEGFERWTAPGVDPEAPWARGDVVGRIQVPEGDVTSVIAVSTLCQWKNRTWSIIAADDSRFRLNRSSITSDSVSLAAPPGPGRGDWADWPGVSAMDDQFVTTRIDHSEAVSVRIKTSPFGRPELMETFFVPSPAESPYVTRERARELAGVGGVCRLRDGWCLLDADGRVVFAVADNEVPLPTGGSRDEVGVVATEVVRGSR